MLFVNNQKQLNTFTFIMIIMLHALYKMLRLNLKKFWKENEGIEIKVHRMCIKLTE